MLKALKNILTLTILVLVVPAVFYFYDKHNKEIALQDEETPDELGIDDSIDQVLSFGRNSYEINNECREVNSLSEKNLIGSTIVIVTSDCDSNYALLGVLEKLSLIHI